MKRYLIIIEERLEEPSWIFSPDWRRASQIQIAGSNPWQKICTWEHSTGLVLEMKQRDQPATISVRSHGADESCPCCTLIEITPRSTRGQPVAEEAVTTFIKLMNLLTGKKAKIYTDWDAVTGIQPLKADFP